MKFKKYKNTLMSVAAKLNQNKIPFQLSGGFAATLYGSKRPVYDIDIDVSKKDIKKVTKIFKKNIIVDFHNMVDEKFDIWMMTVKINDVNVDITQVEDFYLLKNGVKLKMETDLSKSKIINIKGLNIPVENKNSLLAYKKILMRKSDIMDIKML